MTVDFVTEAASKKPTALPSGYMFVLTLYGIPIIGLEPMLPFTSDIYLENSCVMLYKYKVTLSPSFKIELPFLSLPNICNGNSPNNSINSGPLI